MFSKSVLNNSPNPVFMRVSKHFMVSIIASLGDNNVSFLQILARFHGP